MKKFKSILIILLTFYIILLSGCGKESALEPGYCTVIQYGYDGSIINKWEHVETPLNWSSHGMCWFDYDGKQYWVNSTNLLVIEE